MALGLSFYVRRKQAQDLHCLQKEKQRNSLRLRMRLHVFVCGPGFTSKSTTRPDCYTFVTPSKPIIPREDF